MRIIEEQKLNLDDLVLVPQRNTLQSRSQVKLEREFLFYHSPRKFSGIPIFCANMSAIAGFEMGKALANHSMCCALHKFFTLEELVEFYKKAPITTKNYVWPTIGKNYTEIEKLRKLQQALGSAPNIVIDVPNAHLEMIVEFCADVRSEFPDSIIMGGNCTTSEMTAELIIHGGLDIVKINIGTGNVCTSRLVAGVGYGSASSIIECASTAHGLKSGDRRLGLVCADGGLRCPGDFSKSFALGSDFLMAGSYFAGLDENCGEWEREESIIYKYIPEEERRKYGFWEGYIYSYAINGSSKTIITGNKSEEGMVLGRKKALKFYGMSSREAQEKHYGEYKPYRASEGRSTTIPYKGTVDEIVQELCGGLRSTGTYIGANSLKDFSKCAVFAKVNQIHRNMEL